MDIYYSNYIKEAGFNKKVILLFVTNNSKFKRSYDFLSILEIFSMYLVPDYDSFLEIMCYKEQDKANDDGFLFYFVIDNNFAPRASVYNMLKLLIKKINNYRVLSFQDYEILKKLFWKDYLLGKGIDVTNPIIKINNFLFDNPLDVNFKGVFEWGDLILPSLLDDYSMTYEGAYEYDKVLIHKNDIVFDCGANVGSFSALALSKGNEVHAFEPIPETFSLLSYHLRHFNKSKLYLNNVGLSYQKGFINFDSTLNLVIDGMSIQYT